MDRSAKLVQAFPTLIWSDKVSKVWWWCSCCRCLVSWISSWFNRIVLEISRSFTIVPRQFRLMREGSTPRMDRQAIIRLLHRSLYIIIFKGFQTPVDELILECGCSSHTCLAPFATISIIPTVNCQWWGNQKGVKNRPLVADLELEKISFQLRQTGFAPNFYGGQSNPFSFTLWSTGTQSYFWNGETTVESSPESTWKKAQWTAEAPWKR